MITEDKICLTLSLGPQSYHIECFTFFCHLLFNSFSISTWPTTSCRVEPCR